MKLFTLPACGNFFISSCILILTMFFDHNPLRAQDEDLNVIKGKIRNRQWLHFTDSRNALYHHITGQAFQMLDERSELVAEVSSLRDWKQRQKWIFKTLTDIVGPFPDRNPLNARIARIINKSDYRIEHIVYESQPEFYVTSSLFLPEAREGQNKYPVVIFCSGHSEVGYRDSRKQQVILNLVKKGFIVFAFDPVGQGERLEYYDPDTGNSMVGGPTIEHSYPGTQAFITGSSQARYMIWDGIRAIDYLLTREEVDPERIGITGTSGGGTQSAYIAAFDDRVYAAAPGLYLTNMTRLLQTIGPADAEQNLFNQIARGIDHPDLLAVRAPRPALMITTTRDIFSIQGARETAKEVSRIYEAYGKQRNFSMVEDDALHAFTEKNREAMYAFFQKHLNNPGSPNDEEVALLSEDELRVTKTGQVSTSLGGETVFSLNREEAERQITALQMSREQPGSHISRVLKSARQLSGYQEPLNAGEPVFTGRIQRNGYSVEMYFVQGEGDYIIPYLLMIPEQPANKSMIYLHPSGKAAEASADGEIEWFVRQGFTVLAPDMVGVGEMGPGVVTGDAFIDSVSHNMWYGSMLIGRSIAGIRAGDVVRLNMLLKNITGTSETYGVARHGMAPVLLHAAAFDSTIAHVALLEPYASYRSIVSTRFYNSDFVHNVVPGALSAYDLPDLAGSLAPRRLIVAGITNGAGKRSDDEKLMEDLSFIKAAYEAEKAGKQLKISKDGSLKSLHDLFAGSSK